MVFRKNIIYLLILILFSVWLSVFSIDNNLHVIACDVGQGDAILIQRNKTQILIDSGSNNRVLDCLGKYMPFFDKDIELVISTHVDKDHSGGFPDVFGSYKINNFLTNRLDNPKFSNQNIELLRKVVGGSGTKVIYPSKGTTIRVGMIYLDILNPEGEDQISNIKNQNLKTNDTSIVILLRYDQFKGLFLGDLELNVSEDLFADLQVRPLDYIKISHHGSRNGTSKKLLELLMPKIAVISVGKNSYGHPNKEVLEILKSMGIKILRTDNMGDINIKI